MRKALLLLTLILGCVVTYAQSTAQNAVLLLFPAAWCAQHTGDTKFKVYSTATSMTPIGYGLTADAAWQDAADRLGTH